MRRLLAALPVLTPPAFSQELPTTFPRPPPAQDGDQIRLETVARGLEHPWSLAFPPDGRMLVTERPGRRHWTGRLLDVALDPGLARNATLFVTPGERYAYRDQAQGLASLFGKIVRIAPDGTIPPDNPFVGCRSARQEIWSYGHRNVRGATLDTEGRLITCGVDYSGQRIRDVRQAPDGFVYLLTDSADGHLLRLRPW